MEAMMNSGREWDWMDGKKIKVEITYSEPIQLATNKMGDRRVVGSEIDPHHSIEEQISSACTGGIAAMVYKGLRSFKVEVVDV
jgi:hypothetical protein|tara:strand:- start:308 stop:556 length:249 start_codon:yes stop_codon:yes gene_type:complete